MHTQYHKHPDYMTESNPEADDGRILRYLRQAFTLHLSFVHLSQIDRA